MKKRKYYEFSKMLMVSLIDNDTTQKEICEKTGIAQCVISKYFRGTALPGGDNLYKIAKALNMNVEQAFETVGVHEYLPERYTHIYPLTGLCLPFTRLTCVGVSSA